MTKPFKLVTFARNANELHTAATAGYHEILLEPTALATLGTLSTAAAEDLAKDARAQNMRAVLVWDRLMVDHGLNEAISALRSIDLSLFDAIRVLDPGALEYVLNETNSSLKIQLVLRTGAHNFTAIETWCRYAGPRLERAVLSTEIPRAKLAEYIKRLNVEVEVLGLGPIQLFYSPRRLLSYQHPEWQLAQPEFDAKHTNSLLEATADCEENTHQGFRLQQSQHGTVMFHSKDYSLLDRTEDLSEIGLAAFRVDLRLESATQWYTQVAKLIQNPTQEAVEQFTASYPKKVTRCFYQTNATDVLFKKLKNHSTQRTDALNPVYIGDVIEIKSKERVIVYVQGKNQTLRVGKDVVFITPKGKQITFQIPELRNLNGERVDEIGSEQYAVLPYVRLATPTSGVYYV